MIPRSWFRQEEAVQPSPRQGQRHNPCPDRPGHPQSVTLDRRRYRLTVSGSGSGPILLCRVADRIGRQFRGRMGVESGK